MSYGNKYKMRYMCQEEQVALIIQQINYTGAMTNLVAAPDPIVESLDAEGDDKFAFFKARSIKFRILIATKGDYSEFREINNFDYKVQLWLEGINIGSFWLNDEIFSEPYALGGYYMELTATDGLSILSGRRITMANRKTHWGMVKECLDAIGLEIGIVDAIGLVEDDQVTTAGPLTQTKYETNNFTEDQKPNRRWTLERVLKSILNTYTASITMVNNLWVITNIESFSETGGVVGFEYTYFGTYVGVYTGVADLTYSAILGTNKFVVRPGGDRNKIKGTRELTVKQNYGKGSGNLFKNPNLIDYSLVSDVKNFDFWYMVYGLDPTEYNVYGSNMVRNKDNQNYIYFDESDGDQTFYTKIDDYDSMPLDVIKEYVFEIKYALLQSLNSLSGSHKIGFQLEVNDEGTIKYLDFENQEWTAMETLNLYEDIDTQQEDAFDWQNLKVRVTGYPGGKLKLTIFCYEKDLSIVYNGAAFGGFRFYLADVENSTGLKYTLGVTDEDLVGAENEILEFDQVDTPADIPNGELYYSNYLSLLDDSLTHNWQSQNYEGTLADIALQVRLEQYGRNIEVKRFPGIGKLTPHSRLIDENGKMFQIIAYTLSRRQNFFEVSCEEVVEPLSIAISLFETNYVDSDNSSNNTTEPGTGTSTGTTVGENNKVSMMDKYGVETGPPGKLMSPLFNRAYYANQSLYSPMGVGAALHNSFHDYLEVLLGRYPIVSTGSTTEWVATDRLLAIGCGEDWDKLDTALEILKNGTVWYKGQPKAGTESSVTSGQHTVTFERAYVDDLFTARGTVRSGYEVFEIIVLSQTAGGFTYYTAMAGDLWWDTIKHTS